MIRKIAVTITLIVVLLSADLLAQSHHDWSYNLGMYEVNVRQFTQEGTFTAFEPHLERLKELGVGILWFMPVHPIGEENRLGSLGSYYSVKDYYDVNPEFGTMEEFKALVDKAHNMGFYILIDWVANHTAWDNPLTVTNPDWYTKDGNGNFIPPVGTNWTDVIDLDYSKQGLREYMINAMSFWINEIDVDGFRCDAASMVPLDFWNDAIIELKNLKPDILILAEADGIEYHDAGFDITFAWGLYGFGNGVLTKIVNRVFDANNLRSYVRNELTNFPGDDYRLYFTSNHDENSWHGTVFERFGDAAEIFAVITLTINSMPLIYSGQEAGLNKRLQFFEKDLIPWIQHPFNSVYKELLHLKKENKALWNGISGGSAQRILTNNNPDIYAFIREKEDDRLFVVLNLTDTVQTIIPEGELFIGKYVDVFSKDTMMLYQGYEINLDPWKYVVYNKINDLTIVMKEENNDFGYTLSQNYPNPFNPTTNISYSIGNGIQIGQKTLLKIYNILGQEITTLIDEIQTTGSYNKKFDGSKLNSGIYFYTLRSGNFIQTKKMILVN